MEGKVMLNAGAMIASHNKHSLKGKIRTMSLGILMPLGQYAQTKRRAIITSMTNEPAPCLDI